MHYFVTGGAGFIGSHLVERLIAEGNRVTVLDDLSTGSKANLTEALKSSRVIFECGSVLDEARVNRLAEHCDALIHLAAAVGVRKILAQPLESMRTNIAGTENVLEAARQFRKPVLTASTSEVYGKNELSQLCESSDSVFGSAQISRWSYATAKKIDEYLALAYHREHGVPVVVARFFNIVGPRQTSAYGSVLPNFVASAVTGAPIRVFGDGMQTRNFTSVWDCVDAMMALLSTPAAFGEVFNIGAPAEISILDLAKKIRTLTCSKSRIELVPYDKAYPEGGFEDMRSRRPCICKIQQYTDWTPKVSLEEVISATAAHGVVPAVAPKLVAAASEQSRPRQTREAAAAG